MNGKQLPWLPLKCSNMLCAICGLEDGFPIPIIMSLDPSARGKTVCKPCFFLWYENTGTVDDIREKRLKGVTHES